jgi:uncharacterized protein
MTEQTTRLPRRNLLRGAAAAGAIAVAGSSIYRSSSAQAAASANSFTILSFCGGGIRGLLSVTMLSRLYKRYPNIVSAANMLAGTSTGGGMIAALSSVGKQTPPDLVAFFKTEEAHFYAHPVSTAPNQPAYSTEMFFTDMIVKYRAHKLSDITQKVLFTSFNVGDPSTPWKPVLYHNFPNSANAETLVADAVVSTGAMPGMFGSFKGNVDGAFVNHDPTIAAIALAVNSGISLGDIVVICFGTGLMPNSLGRATVNWGAQQWQEGDPDHLYNVPPLLVNGTPSPILNISLSGSSTNLIPMLAGLMLPGRYANLNPALDKYIPENAYTPADLTALTAAAHAVDIAAAARLVKAYWPASGDVR